MDRRTVVGGGLALAMPWAAAAKPPSVGGLAPAYELTLIDDTKITQADLAGQVVVFNFWATWCVPCRKEIPELERYFIANKTKGLRIFTITTEGSLPIRLLKALFDNMQMSAVRKIKGPYRALGGVPTNYTSIAAAPFAMPAPGRSTEMILKPSSRHCFVRQPDLNGCGSRGHQRRHAGQFAAFHPFKKRAASG